LPIDQDSSGVRASYALPVPLGDQPAFLTQENKMLARDHKTAFA
jgi:hypothetical protein